MFVTLSLLNGLSGRKTDCTINFVMAQGLFLGQIEDHNSRCALLITEKRLLANGGERRDAKLRVDRCRELPFTVIWENRTTS